MPSKITTIYIDDTCIRMMVTRGRRINKLADVPLDAGLGEVSAQAKEAEIVAKIKQLFKSRKINAKKVIIGLSGLHVLSRPIVLPQLPRAMLDEAVIREAKRVLPVPPEQLYISWQLISATEGKIQAFMIGVPRQIADNVLSILRQLGQKPYLMDVKPLALTRLVKQPTAIVVDVQAREFDIVILSEGIPQPIRTVPFPNEAISLTDKVVIVKDEIKRTVQFFNNNRPEKPIPPDVTMYVSGEIAEEPEVYQSLATELGYRVAPLTSPLKCPKQLDPSHYLVNIGLALKVLPREAGALLTNLNTLPASYLPKPLSLFKLLVLPATALGIGIISLLAMTIQDAAASISTVQNKLDTTNRILQQRTTQKKDLTTSIADLEKKLVVTEAANSVYTAFLDKLNKQGDVINGDLKSTTSSLVQGVDLTSINHSGANVNIHGFAPTEAEVLDYADNLRTSGRFSEVTISRVSRVEKRAGEAVADSGDEGTVAEVIEEVSDDGTIPGVSDNGTIPGVSDNGTIPGVSDNGTASAVTGTASAVTDDETTENVNGNPFEFTLTLKLKVQE